ncbi:hypothetical protein [Saccharopolyspora taberi]|uniref:Uncharacterized protein n=1 Tax=Saccharopolyspora taberi TaxID=60895 RepID=A0ABN3VE36_9PSEU
MSRLEMIARAFLRYLYKDPHFRPEVSGFLADPGLVVPVGRDEFAQVVDALRGQELITTSGEEAGGVPARAGLTGSGLICAGHHDGDIAAWMNARAAPLAVLEDEPPVVIPEQPRPADFTGLARVARVVLLTLPTVQERRGGGDRVERAARELWETARLPRPDPAEVRELARALRGELVGGPVAHTLGVVLVDGLDEEMARAGLS